MFIQESYLNATDGYIFGESDVYECWTDDVGEIFRNCQREYGGCTGPVFIDDVNGVSRKIGWVFSRTEKYEDSRDTYVREVWVTLHEQTPVTKTTNFYHFMGD